MASQPTAILHIGATLLVYLFGVFSSLPGSESSGEIHGVVLTSEGAPLVGASVQIKTSAPSRVEEIANRPNLQTSAMTDASGRFTFRNLPTGFKFTLVAVKPDYLPEVTERITAGSDSLTFRLKPITPPGESRTQTVRGRIKRPDGSPLPGARINILVFYSGNSARMGGDGISDTTVTTDDTGHFTIRSAVTVDAMTGYVSAPGFARRAIRLTSGQDQEVTMSGGSSLTGRILHQGKPVSKLKVGLTPRGQKMNQSVGLFDATPTDADGRFEITHLPPDADYTLYAKMDPTSPGIFADRAVHVGGENHTTDLGEISLVQGVRLQGRIVTDGGGPLPEGSKLHLSRPDSRDAVTVPLSETGEFSLSAIPPGLVNVYPRIPGYIVSKKNASYPPAGYRLTGLVEKDILDLLVLVEKTLVTESVVTVTPRADGETSGSYLKRPLEGISRANQ